MRVPRLHLDRVLTAGADLDLDENGARHVRTVLRLRPGAPVVVFDGRGAAFEAELLACTRNGARVRLAGALEADLESPLRVTLALGVSRGERMDLAVQKAVELGAAGIVPLFTEHGVVRLDGARADRRQAHWQGVVVNACEQCGRNRVPQVAAIRTIAQWLADCGPAEAGSPRLMPDPRAATGLLDLAPPADAAVTLLIGPEGGLSDSERAAAGRHGFTAVRLGPRILRTETAVIATLAAVTTLWGDLGQSR